MPSRALTDDMTPSHLTLEHHGASNYTRFYTPHRLA